MVKAQTGEIGLEPKINLPKTKTSQKFSACRLEMEKGKHRKGLTIKMSERDSPVVSQNSD